MLKSIPLKTAARASVFPTLALFAIVLLLVFSPVLVLAQVPCERIELKEPLHASQLNQSQPELVWAGDAQKSYRLQVAVVLPEGRIVDSFDTVVSGNRWKFNRPIVVPHAVVKVIVSSNCPLLSVQDLHADRPYFFVDMRSACVVTPQSLKQIAQKLQWETRSSASSYTIQIFELTAANGKLEKMVLAGRYESPQPNWNIPKDLLEKMRDSSKSRSAWSASVQAQCGNTLFSRPQAITLLLAE